MANAAAAFALAATALVAGACSGSDGGTTRLVVVGDSLAAGRFADSRHEAFPQRVAAALGRDGRRVRLSLLAVPGAPVDYLAAQRLPRGGGIVVLEAGTNDFLHQTPRARFASDYRALVAKALNASPSPRLVCLTIWAPPRATGSAPSQIPASFYNTTIRRECREGSVVDVSRLYDAQPPTRGPAGRPTFLGPGDDFHPNSQGHAAIARLIEARLR